MGGELDEGYSMTKRQRRRQQVLLWFPSSKKCKEHCCQLWTLCQQQNVFNHEKYSIKCIEAFDITAHEQYRKQNHSGDGKEAWILKLCTLMGKQRKESEEACWWFAIMPFGWLTIKLVKRVWISLSLSLYLSILHLSFYLDHSFIHCWIVGNLI